MAMVKVRRAELGRVEDAEALVTLLDHYARDPMGGGEPLPERVYQQLPAALAARSDALTLLAEIDGNAVGLLNAFEGFSTFLCAPLLNIHDIVVHSDYRRRGIARALLTEAEKIARERGCCKLTLEVLEGNTTAQQVYRQCGFAGYQLDPEAGNALFWQKSL